MHQTCTGTKKAQVLNFKVHQTCTGTKKTKVLNFKVRQTCTGQKNKNNKKNKNFPIYLGRGKYPSVHFEVQNFCFLSLCRFGALWSSKLVFFGPCAGLVSFEVQNLMQLFISIVILFLLFANVLDTCATFCFPCSFLKGQVRFSCKGFTIGRLIGPFSEPHSGFRKLDAFSFWNVNMFKVICMQDAFYTGICSVFEHVTYWLYGYLVWWPPPQELELESPLGGWPYIYNDCIWIYVYIYKIYIYKYIFCRPFFRNNQAFFTKTWSTIKFGHVQGTGGAKGDLLGKFFLHVEETKPERIRISSWAAWTKHLADMNHEILIGV